jgi:hypothetical protein
LRYLLREDHFGIIVCLLLNIHHLLLAELVLVVILSEPERLLVNN